jgi:hypothetical protein
VPKVSMAKVIPTLQPPPVKVIAQDRPVQPPSRDIAQPSNVNTSASISGIHPDQLQADFVLHKARPTTSMIALPRQAVLESVLPSLITAPEPSSTTTQAPTTKPKPLQQDISPYVMAEEPMPARPAVQVAQSIADPLSSGQPPSKPPYQAHRPLRRTASDAGITSPTKRPLPLNNLLNINPARKTDRSFARSSTIANPNNATKERQKAQAQAQPPPIPEVDEAALQREKRLSDERNATGPWTKEAWDLFGFTALPRMVKEKKEIQVWEYGPEAPVQPRPAGESVGTAVVSMREVKALGGFVNANTGRASVAA